MKLFEDRKEQILRLLRELYRKDGKNFYVTFLTQERFAINPRPSDYLTPLGIYAYTVETLYDYYLKQNYHIPFSDRPYIAISKRKPNANVLKTSEITSRLIQELVSTFEDLYGYHPHVEKADSRSKTFFQTLYDAATYLARGINIKTSIISNRVLREMGYDIVVDECTGAIHEEEPCQVVILDPSKVELVGIFENPLIFKGEVVKSLLKGRKDPVILLTYLILSKNPDTSKLSEYTGYSKEIVDYLNEVIQQKKRKYDNIFRFLDEEFHEIAEIARNRFNMKVFPMKVFGTVFHHYVKRRPLETFRLLASFKSTSPDFKRFMNSVFANNEVGDINVPVKLLVEILKNHTPIYGETFYHVVELVENPDKYISNIIGNVRLSPRNKEKLKKALSELVHHFLSSRRSAKSAELDRFVSFVRVTVPVLISTFTSPVYDDKTVIASIDNSLERIKKLVDPSVFENFKKAFVEIALDTRNER